MPDQAYWFPISGQDTGNRPVTQDKAIYQIDRQTIVPLKYTGGAQRVGFSVLMGIDTTQFQNWNINLNIHDQLSGGTAQFTLTNPSLSFRATKNGFEGSLVVDELLQALDAKLNQNLLQFTVEFEASRSLNQPNIISSGQTKEPLHLLLQKVVVVLPDLFGSSLSIQKTQHWPLSTSNPQSSLDALQCNARGEPINPVTSLQLNLPPTIDPKQWETWLQQGLPRLQVRKGGKTETIPYYRVQGYPYDWRSPIKTLIDQVLGAEATLTEAQQSKSFQPAPTFAGEGNTPAKLPSLRTILKYAQLANPFLDTHVALVGHGIGGLIVNAAIRRAEAKALVNRAFFVATPFFGALAAYQAFLTNSLRMAEGTGFGLSGADLLKLAPNLSLLYYLAPSHRFPYPVARLTDSDGTVRRLERTKVDANGVIAEIRTLAERAKMDNLIQSTKLWNRTLAETAHQFYRDSETNAIQIGEDVCLVFYASQGAKSTVGQVRFDARSTFSGDAQKRLSVFLTNGDGVIPTESLRGDVAADRLYELAGALNHFQCIHAQVVWTEIMPRLVGWMDAGSPPEPPAPWTEDELVSWMAFKLVDEDGQPIANELYRIVLPNGTVQEGQLDAQGQTRLEGITATDTYQISFPNIDANDWLEANGINIETQPTSWAFFELVDEEGQPVANEAYRVTLPDGSEQKGRLNAKGQGQVKVVGVDSGNCTVAFPNIDTNDWLQTDGEASEPINWVDFELVDEDGVPVAYEIYQIKLPDGTVREGQLNAQGQVRLRGITAKTCAIAFPNIDGNDWQPIGSNI